MQPVKQLDEIIISKIRNQFSTEDTSSKLLNHEAEAGGRARGILVLAKKIDPHKLFQIKF